MDELTGLVCFSLTFGAMQLTPMSLDIFDEFSTLPSMVVESPVFWLRIAVSYNWRGLTAQISDCRVHTRGIIDSLMMDRMNG